MQKCNQMFYLFVNVFHFYTPPHDLLDNRRLFIDTSHFNCQPANEFATPSLNGCDCTSTVRTE